MTAQIGDKFTFENGNYELVAISTPIKFNPEDYGITPEWRSTACYRGYWCEYKISNDEIILENLYINSKDGVYPEINRVFY